VGDKLYELEQKEKEVYNRRHTIGQIADQKAKFAKEQPYYPDAPKEPVSASELIKQQQDILARNGENQRKRAKVKELEMRAEQLQKQLDEIQVKLIETQQELDMAYMSAKDIEDQSTEELERNIANIEEINVRVRANLDKDKAETDAQDYADQYNTLTVELEKVRQAKTDLLTGADLPLPGLSVVEGELTYQGHKWDNMSGSDQLKVSVAIVRKLNPKCGFVLMDKLEQMDMDTLAEFGAWLEQEGLQAIATRVSTGDECSIVIEDGYVVGAEQPVQEVPKWKAGEF